MIKGGLVSITFRSLSVEQIVSLVCESGLQGIEWGGDRHVPHGNFKEAERVKALTRSAGLEVVAYGSYYRAGVSEEEGLAFTTVLKTAKCLGARTLRVWPGNLGSQDCSAEFRKTVVEDLKRIGRLAQAEGIDVRCEYHGGTLTDTSVSVKKLLHELRDEPVGFYWQPCKEQSVEYCLASLEEILSRLGPLHVFHWSFQNKKVDRRPLLEGEERWLLYLEMARRAEGDRYAMIEFVREEKPAQFLQDAGALVRWLAHVNQASGAGEMNAQ